MCCSINSTHGGVGFCLFLPPNLTSFDLPLNPPVLFGSTYLHGSANLSHLMFFRNSLLCFMQEKELVAFRMREVHKTLLSLFFSFFPFLILLVDSGLSCVAGD